MDNIMILNNENIGISYAELNEDEVFLYNKDSKYCFKVYITESNWKEIRNLMIGEKKQFDFNECCLSENNIPALISPNSYVEKKRKAIMNYYFILNAKILMI